MSQISRSNQEEEEKKFEIEYNPIFSLLKFL